MYLQKRLKNGESPITLPKIATIEDYITKKLLPATPEENVRQTMVKKLIKEYNYSSEQIQTVPEFRITKGSKKIGPVDIAVFRNKNKILDNLYIIVETKREGREEGVDQLKSYMAPTKAEFGIWFNGSDMLFVQSTKNAPFWRPIPDIPKRGETLEEIGLYRKKDLVPCTDLKTIFETCHNYIYANEGLLKEKVFNEVLKLIFIKMVDEKDFTNEKCEFRITANELREIQEGKSNDFAARIEKLFFKVKTQYEDVFQNEHESLNLKVPTIAKIVSLLQKYSLINTPTDVKGTAFQTFVHAHERGERGEFFTPYPILQLAVEMLNFGQSDRIIDPACGSGGFLVEAMKKVFVSIDSSGILISDKQRTKLKEEYTHNCIRGIDINPDLARVAKMHMIIYDDGHTGIFSENSLESYDILAKTAMDAGAGKIERNSFKILLTNPPFGTKGKITSKLILQQYDLGHKWKLKEETQRIEKTDELMESQVPDILFIERCIDLISEDFGKMAIVVPDGILNNSTMEYVRSFIKSKARILAVVSLPQETFIPHGTGSKTSLLFLQKVPQLELEKLKAQDYPIFMAICEKIGYDIHGTTLFQKNSLGQVIDEKGKPVTNVNDAAIDTDIHEIITAFRTFKEENNLDV
jgi:type I restriction enzyme M protein